MLQNSNVSKSLSPTYSCQDYLLDQLMDEIILSFFYFVRAVKRESKTRSDVVFKVSRCKSTVTGQHDMFHVVTPKSELSHLWIYRCIQPLSVGHGWKTSRGDIFQVNVHAVSPPHYPSLISFQAAAKFTQRAPTWRPTKGHTQVRNPLFWGFHFGMMSALIRSSAFEPLI